MNTSSAPSAVPVSRRWDEIIGGDSFLTDPDAVRTAMEARGLLFDGRSLLNVARPRFEPRPEIEKSQRVAGALARALGAIWPRLLAAHRSGSTGLPGFDDWIARVAAIDPAHVDDPAGAPGTVLRIDAYGIGDATGLIELNADVPEAAIILDGIRKILEISETFNLIRREFNLELMHAQPAQDRTLLASWKGPGRPRIGVVGWLEGVEAVTARMVSSHLRMHGYRVEAAEPGDCGFDGKRFFAAGRPVDIVYRLCHLPEMFEREEECAPLFDAVRAGTVPVVNTPAAELFGHKYLLALLGHSPWRDDIAPHDRALIERALPWGAVVAPGPARTPEGETGDLPAWIAAHREGLVLKSAHGQGGADVLLGWRAGQDEWEKFLSELLAAGGVVQGRLAAPRDTYPLIAPGAPREEFYGDTIIFVYDGVPSGLGSRLSRNEITNVSRGGSIVPVYAVG